MTLRKLLTLEVLALLTLIVNIVHLGSRGSQVPITLGTLAVILRDIRHITLKGFYALYASFSSGICDCISGYAIDALRALLMPIVLG